MATQTAAKDKPKTDAKVDTSASAENKGAVVALHAPRLPYHPAIQERGFDEGQWKTLVEAVFPAAKTVDAVLLAMDYCKARKLDIFKRAVHIVPIWDRDKDNGPNKKKGGYIETVWPGIAEHRITAVRTGQYAGTEPAQFGPVVNHVFEWESTDEQTGATSRGNFSLRLPEWCQLTVYKLVQGQRCPFPGPRVYWLETYSRKGRSILPNDKWKASPFQMIEKCAEAAALRRAFPEEFGDEWTAEEAGAIERAAENAIDVTPQAERPTRETPPKPEPFAVVDGNGEITEFEQAAEAVAALAKLFAEAKTKDALAGLWESNNLPGQMRDRGLPDLAQAVHDAFAAASKALEPKPETQPDSPAAAADVAPPTASAASRPKFSAMTISVTITEDGASNWRAWGEAMIAQIKEAETEDDLSEVITLNRAAFGNCAERAPNAYKSIDGALDKRRKQIKAGLPRDAGVSA